MELLPGDFLYDAYAISELDADLIMPFEVADFFSVVRRISGRITFEEIALFRRRDGRRLEVPATIGISRVGLHRKPDPEHREITMNAATDLASGIRLLTGLPAVQFEIVDQALEFEVPRPVSHLVLLPVDDLPVMFDDRTELLRYARKLRGFAGTQGEKEHLEPRIRREEQFLAAGVRIAQVRGSELMHVD